MVKQVRGNSGKVYTYADDVPDEWIVEDIDKLEPPQTDLLSVKGVKGLFSTMGESVDASLAGAKYGAHKELLDAMQADLTQYTPGTPEYDAQQKKILDQQQITHDWAAATGHLTQSIKEQVPNPSIPMEAAMGVAPSMVNMAPSLVTRNPLPLAQQGLFQFREGAYGAASDQGADPGEASAYANISGPMEAVTEWMPMGKLFAELGKESTKALVAKTLGREIASEEVNTIVDKFAEQAIVTPDKPFNQFISELGHDIAVTGLQAGMQTGVMAPVIHSMNAPGNIERNPRGTTPPMEETTEPARETPPPPAAKVNFTDTQTEIASNQALIDAIEESLNSGATLGEKIDVPTPPPVEKTLSDLVQGLDVRQAADTGMSNEVLRNPHNFEDQNTAVPRSERRVVRALGMSGLVNKPLGEISSLDFDLSAGPVVIQAGEDTHVRPSHYMKAVVQDIYELAREFNPKGVYVILPEDTGVTGDAMREQAASFKHNGVHYIIPRHLTNQKQSGSHKSKKGSGKYSGDANVNAYSSLGHEFGHTLIEDFFFSELTPQEYNAMRLALTQGTYDEALAQKLSPAAQQVLSDWRSLRDDTLTGKIGGREAAMRWLSPAKLQNKTVMRQRFGFGGGGFSAKRFAQKAGINYQLSFDEYLAEQVAKTMFAEERLGKSAVLDATFAKSFDTDTLLGSMEARIQEFLGPLLARLKELYGKLSAMGLVEAGKSTQDWMEELALRAAEFNDKAGKNTLVKGAKTAATEAPVDEPKVDWTSPARRNVLTAALKNLRETGVVKTNSKQHRELAGLLKTGQFEEFVNKIEPLIGERLKFDILEAESADLKGWQPAWVVGSGGTANWTISPENPLGKVDLRKIGTGEGTIWQGWGHYSGEAAKTYRHYAGYDVAQSAPHEMVYQGRRYEWGTPDLGRRILKEANTKDLRELLMLKNGGDPVSTELDLDDIVNTVISNVVYSSKPNPEVRRVDKKEQDRLDREALKDHLSKKAEILARARETIAQTLDLDLDVKLLAPIFVKAAQLRYVHGEPHVRHFEILKPFDTFARWDWGWEDQSDYVKRALAKLPERYREFFTPRAQLGVPELLASINSPAAKDYLKAHGLAIRHENGFLSMYLLKNSPSKFTEADVGQYVHGLPDPNDLIVQVIYGDAITAGNETHQVKKEPFLFAQHFLPPVQDSVAAARLRAWLDAAFVKSYGATADPKLPKEYSQEIQQALGIAPPNNTMEDAYWELVAWVAYEKGIPYKTRDRNKPAIPAAKVASKILSSVGISGVVYLNNTARSKGPKYIPGAKPPAPATNSWNVVTYNHNDVRILAKDTTTRGYRIPAEKIGQAKARKEWRLKGVESELFKNWFEGSVVVQADGKPLTLMYNTAVDMKAPSSRQKIQVGFQNYMHALFWAGPMTEMAGRTRILPGWARITNPLRVESRGHTVLPGELDGYVSRAIAEGHDGVIVDMPELQDQMYVSFGVGSATYDPDYKHEGTVSSQMRYDRTDPEGHETATKWEVLKQKLQLPVLADAVNKVYHAQWYALQLQQIAHMNPQWTWLHNFAAEMQAFYRKVGLMHSPADAVVRQLQWFGKENLARMQKFTLAEYRGREHWTEIVKVDQNHWEHRPTARLIEEIRKIGIDPDSVSGKRFLRIYIEAKNALQRQQDEMRLVLIGLRTKKYAAEGLTDKRNQSIMEVVQTFNVLRGYPFWPQTAFGKNVVQVWSSDEAGKELLFEGATDSDREARELELKARAKYPGGSVKSFVRTAEEGLLLRLPVEFLDDVEVILGLDSANPEDQAKLAQIKEAMQSLYEKTPLKAYNPMRFQVEGGSTDFIKTYADFALRNANFIAKMEYRKLLQMAIAQAEHDPDNQSFLKNKSEIERALGFMKATVNYAMNPQEELTTIRGVVAIGYLWGSVKTALLNFWGLAHTLLWMNRELGYLKGGFNFAKAFGGAVRTQAHEWGDTVGRIMTGSAEAALTSLTDPNWEMVDGQPTELRLALEQAKSENVLDQSYAYYLATQATRGQLIRMASGSMPGKVFKGIVDSGMSLFRGTELLIRRATFVGAYKVMQQTKPEATPKERYEEAVRMVGLLQGDYTKGNRPQIMRGKLLSFITIFMTFVQNASWNVYGGLEIGLRRQEAMEGRASPAMYRSYTAQLVLLYLLAVGLEGLPGMENVMDLLDAGFKKFNNGKSARTALREVLMEVGVDDPMKVVRGATFNLGGFDLSRSIGQGRLVPGTDVLAEEHGTAKEAIGAGVTALSGVGGGYIQWLVDTIGALSKAGTAGLDMGDVAGKQMARLPGGLGNIFKAAQWAERDARGPQGGLIAYDAKTGRMREIQTWEIVGKAMGFQPASVSAGQNIKAEQYEAREYWTTRQKVLKDAYYQAKVIARDREAVADVNKAIAEFNRKVPSKNLQITVKKLQQSEAARKRSVKASEELTTVQKSHQELYEQAVESFGAIDTE